VAEPYFQNEEGLIQEFEYDYDLVNEFDTQLGKAYAQLVCLTSFCFYPGLCCYWCCEKQNIIDRNNAKHVCITQDGIRYSVAQHKAGCRCDCMEEGKKQKTVPFDKITDCDVTEPAGASGPVCCLVNNTVPVVVVDTASSGQVGQDGQVMHELEIRGLKDPHGFKKLVWQVKREGGDRHIPFASGADDSGKGQSNKNTKIGDLLERQNQILEEQNVLLRQIAKNGEMNR